MKIPHLSRAELETWHSIRDLGDDELYAMIATAPSFGLPSRAKDTLVFGTLFKITRKNVERGKETLRKFLEKTRKEVCPSWFEIGKQRRKLSEVEVYALILECVIALIGVHLFPSPVAVAELICRSCEYSLDRLCKDYPHKE